MNFGILSIVFGTWIGLLFITTALFSMRYLVIAPRDDDED